MLERYFVRPRTVHRIRSSWIGPLVEQYLTSAESTAMQCGTWHNAYRLSALRLCEPPVTSPRTPIWKDDQALLTWLSSL